MSNSNLLDETFRCVDAIGYDKTLEVLRQAQFQEIIFEDKRVERVVEIVSKKTGIPVYEIVHGNGRKNERKYAIGFCSHYLSSQDYFNIQMETVKDHLNKDNVITCYMYAKMIVKLNPNHTSDKKFYEIKKELDSVFTEMKNESEKKPNKKQA